MLTTINSNWNCALPIIIFFIISYFLIAVDTVGIVQANSSQILSKVTVENTLIEDLYDTNIYFQINPVSKLTQPPFADPNTKTPIPFLPTESTFCNPNLVGKTTFQGYSIVAGTNNDDQLTGSLKKDLILGLDGDDNIHGSGADDIICGGKGNDYLNGDYESPHDQLEEATSGNDLIFGQDGADVLGGIFGEDSLQGGPGDDEIFGDFGNDYLVGGDGNDKLIGYTGNNIMYGSDGNDKLFGGAEAEKVYGGNDDDYIEGYVGADYIDGGPQYDKCFHDIFEPTQPPATFKNCEVAYDFKD